MILNHNQIITQSFSFSHIFHLPVIIRCVSLGYWFSRMHVDYYLYCSDPWTQLIFLKWCALHFLHFSMHLVLLDIFLKWFHCMWIFTIKSQIKSWFFEMIWNQIKSRKSDWNHDFPITQSNLWMPWHFPLTILVGFLVSM